MKVLPVLRCRQLASKLCQQEKYVLSRCFSTETSTVKQDEQVTQAAIGPKQTKVPSPENSRLMKVAIVGVPNAGKSTIINALTNYDVCPVSRRAHTTRKNQKAVYLDENTQLVFVDTPGLVCIKEVKKFSFTQEFVYGPENSIPTSHVLAVIHDCSSNITRNKLDFRIKRILQKFPDKKSILILNKIDAVKQKSVLLDCVKYLTNGVVGGAPLPLRTFEEKKQSHKPLDMEKILAKAKKQQDETERVTKCSSKHEEAVEKALKFFTPGEIKRGIHQSGWPYFNDVFMVSALEGDGIDLLRRYMILNAVPHGWLYEADTLTDVPPQQLVLSILKAKLLENLPQEIPFKVKPVLEFWEETDAGNLHISFNIKCPKEQYKWRIIGTNGTLINRITEDIEKSVSGLLYRPVKLTLNPVFDKALEKK